MTGRRHDDHHDVMRLLEGRLPEMAQILEHKRENRSIEVPETFHGRRVKECVAVMLVEEADGSETVHIVGDASAAHLQLKGMLHDAIYAFAHKGEPGFTVHAESPST
jgi:hypothetical protein